MRLSSACFCITVGGSTERFDVDSTQSNAYSINRRSGWVLVLNLRKGHRFNEQWVSMPETQLNCSISSFLCEHMPTTTSNARRHKGSSTLIVTYNSSERTCRNESRNCLSAYMSIKAFSLPHAHFPLSFLPTRSRPRNSTHHSQPANHDIPTIPPANPTSTLTTPNQPPTQNVHHHHQQNPHLLAPRTHLRRGTLPIRHLSAKTVLQPLVQPPPPNRNLHRNRMRNLHLRERIRKLCI
jgi:hypothetical protein